VARREPCPQPPSEQPLEIVIDSRFNDFKFHALAAAPRPLRGVHEFVITRCRRFFAFSSGSAAPSIFPAHRRKSRFAKYCTPRRFPGRNLGLRLIAACRRRRSPAAARLLRCTQNLPPQRVLRSQSKKQHVNGALSIYIFTANASKQSKWFKQQF
jgi:hypothetical protein